MSFIFRIRFAIDTFPSIDLLEQSNRRRQELEVKLEYERSIGLEWTCPELRWSENADKGHLPDLAHIDFAHESSIGVSPRAIDLFQSVVPDCGEILPVDIEATHGYQLFHLYGSAVFPAEHEHDTILGDFATAIAEEALDHCSAKSFIRLKGIWNPASTGTVRASSESAVRLWDLAV
jgi:hypothetical protein